MSNITVAPFFLSCCQTFFFKRFLAYVFKVVVFSSEEKHNAFIVSRHQFRELSSGFRTCTHACEYILRDFHDCSSDLLSRRAKELTCANMFHAKRKTDSSHRIKIPRQQDVCECKDGPRANVKQYLLFKPLSDRCGSGLFYIRKWI